MKKTLVALAVLASSGTAFAQAAAPASSVTLFGILDASVTNVDKNAAGASFTGLTDSNVASSQFGMRGSENIGGGLRAIFELTADVNTTNGTFDATAANAYSSGALFRRGSWVGLAGSFGQITLGRRLNPFLIGAAVDQVHAANSTQTARAAAMGYADFWTKNAVTYVSPAMNGFTVHLQHGMSNTAGRTGDGTMMAAVAVYSKGPLNASAGYEKIDGGLTAVEVAATSGVSTVVAAPAVGKKEAQYINARYAMGPITLGAGFFQVKGAIANTAATTSTRDGSSVHARYDFSKQASASLSYNDFEGTKVTTLQARYVLSPRTSLYGLMNSIDNGKVTTFVPTWGARANPRPGNNQTALSAGVIHAF
ncbi:MAG: hypothetical protein RL500_1605 [Pseudomonadota bacterium]|jgi:predicted porin